MSRNASSASARFSSPPSAPPLPAISAHRSLTLMGGGLGRARRTLCLSILRLRRIARQRGLVTLGRGIARLSGSTGVVLSAVSRAVTCPRRFGLKFHRIWGGNRRRSFARSLILDTARLGERLNQALGTIRPKLRRSLSKYQYGAQRNNRHARSRTTSSLQRLRRIIAPA